MKAAILGKKIGMTQVYDENGAILPVTVVQAGPCNVLQVKSVESDGYNAVQIGCEDVKTQRASKPEAGHASKAGCKAKKVVREIRLAGPADVEAGAAVTVDAFEGVLFVDAIGTTKGKGFAGVMKRHHFAGLGMSHGTERKHRSAGSIGGLATNRGWGGDIKKGKRMAGRMGAERCTSRNLKLVRVDKENNLLLIKGAVPGANGGYVLIRASKTAKASKAK